MSGILLFVEDFLMDNGGETVSIERSFIASGDTTLLAFIAKLNVLPAMGVPEIKPVETFSDKPSGRMPMSVLSIVTDVCYIKALLFDCFLDTLN